MKQYSWRHHYIPKFYLKGFTSKSGKFKIYDVKKKRFIKGGKDFSPESYFFEKNANSIHTTIAKSDFIEKHYSKLDSNVSEVFNRINSSSVKNNYNINENDITLLQYFVGVMYWRLPINYEEIHHLLDRNTLRNFGIIIENAREETVEDIELEKKLKHDINFFKSMKYLIPSILYPNIFHCNTPIHILSNSEGLPSICSDNPIIVREPNNFRVYNDNFIFPLTNTEIMVRGEKYNKYGAPIRILIDLVIYKQAKEYVSCTEEKYLEELDKYYKKNFNSLDELRIKLFNELLG